MTFIPDFLELNDLQLSQIVEKMEDDFHLSQAVADVDDGMINSVVTNRVKDEDHFEDFRISQAASFVEGTCKMQNETRNEIYRNETKPNQTKRNSPKRNERGRGVKVQNWPHIKLKNNARHRIKTIY